MLSTNTFDAFTFNHIYYSIKSLFLLICPSRRSQLVQEVSVERKWGQRGGPWEFNLRDMFRWCQLMQADQSPGFFNPGQHVGLVYADRMRSEADKAQVTHPVGVDQTHVLPRVEEAW